MGTIAEIILALLITAVLVGAIYIVIDWQCKKSFKKLEIGDQYSIVIRNPINQIILTITDLDMNKGTVSYNLRKNKTDDSCYDENTVSYKYFFLTLLQDNNVVCIEHIGNITSQWKNY